jgi:hypothetical protein
MIIDDKDDITEINDTITLLWNRINEINKRHKEGNGNRMIDHGLSSARECLANAKGYLNNVHQMAFPVVEA